MKLKNISGLNRFETRYSQAFLFVSLALFLAICGCSSSDGEPNSAPETGARSNGAPACRSVLEQQMAATLSAVETDTDFSLYIEAQDGGTYTFNRGAVTQSTLFNSASTSKWVAAVIILRLVVQDRISLSDHPQDYIPGWDIDAADSLYDMTLSDLLSFTSGLINKPSCIDQPDSDFETCVDEIAAVNADNGELPGAVFNYSSTHLQVAGLMAVKAAGEATWQDLFKNFQEETGLFPNGAFDLPSSGNPRLAGGMHWRGSEYADFIRAFFSGKLLAKPTQTQMLSDQIATAIIGNSPVKRYLDQQWHYGYGIWLQCYSAVFDCDDISYYSSPGIFGAYPFINTDQQFFGLVARQGAYGTLSQGIAVYESVADLAEQWAQAPKSCP